MSESPFFQFYPSDWLGGTRGLTAAETGIYITLTAMMYEEEGPVKADMKRLARLCGSTPAAFKKAIDGLVQTGKLTVDGRGFFNNRVEKEIRKRAEKRQSASDSAKTRWQKSEQKQDASDANASQTQCEVDANQNPEPEPYSKEEPSYEGLSSQPLFDLSQAVAEYNTAAERNGWPRVQRLTEARKAALRGRMQEAGGLAGWRDALAKATASDFLCGRGNRGSPFFASFDFLTRQSSFTKLMEGSYDNRTNGHDATGRPHRVDPALEQIARLAGIGATPGNGRH